MAALTFQVADILTLLAQDMGLNVICEGIDDICAGMCVSSDKSFLDICRQHSGVYNFQIIDGDPIRLVRRTIGEGLVIDRTIYQEDLISRSGGPVVKLARVDVAALPRQIELSYIDPDREYEITTQVARHAGAPVTNTVMSAAIDFAITGEQARALVYSLLYRIWAQLIAFQYEERNLSLEPGDVVQINCDQGIFTALVTETVFTSGRTNQVTARLLYSETGVPRWSLDGSEYIAPGHSDTYSPSRTVGTARFAGNFRLRAHADVIQGYTAWDPGTAVGATISGDNQEILTHADLMTADGALANHGRRYGKYYFEFTVSFDGEYSAAGLVSEYTLIQWFGPNGDGPGYEVADGYYIYSNIFGRVGASVAHGTVICWAVDLDNNLGWEKVGLYADWNNNPNADPSTGVGGSTIRTLSQPATMWPVVVFGGAASTLTETVEANFRGIVPFKGIVPFGFNPGWPPNDVISLSSTKASFSGAFTIRNLAQSWWSTDVYVIPAAAQMPGARFAGGSSLRCGATGGLITTNDHFADAIEVFDGVTAYAYSGYATYSDPTDPMVFFSYIQDGEDYSYWDDLYYTIWFKFVAPETRKYYVTTRDHPEPYMETQLAVYKGTALNNLVQLASSNYLDDDDDAWSAANARWKFYPGFDFNGNYTGGYWNLDYYVSACTFDAEKDETYYFMLGSWRGAGMAIQVTSALDQAVFVGAKLTWPCQSVFCNATTNPQYGRARFGYRTEDYPTPPYSWQYFDFNLNADAWVTNKYIAASFNARGGFGAAGSTKPQYSFASARMYGGSAFTASGVLGVNISCVAWIPGGSALSADASVAMGNRIRPMTFAGAGTLAVTPSGDGYSADVLDPSKLVNAVISDCGRTLTHISTEPGGGMFSTAHDVGGVYYLPVNDFKPENGSFFYFEATVNLTGEASGIGFAPYGAADWNDETSWDGATGLFWLANDTTGAGWHRVPVSMENILLGFATGSLFGLCKNGEVKFATGNMWISVTNIGFTLDPGDTIGIAFMPYYGGIYIRKCPDGAWTGINGAANPSQALYDHGDYDLSNAYRACSGVTTQAGQTPANIPAAFFGGDGASIGESVTFNLGTRPFVGQPPAGAADKDYGLPLPPVDYIPGWPGTRRAALFAAQGTLSAATVFNEPVHDPVTAEHFYPFGLLHVDAFPAFRCHLTGEGSLKVNPRVPWLGGTTVFEPAAHITLSDGGLTATHADSSTAVAHVAFGNARDTGKYYIEFRVRNLATSGGTLGYGSSYGFKNSELNFGFYHTAYGNLYAANGSFIQNIGGATPDDLFCFAIDLDAATAWCRHSWWGTWNGRVPDPDPAQQEGYIFYSWQRLALVPFVEFVGGNTESVTINTKGPFEGAVPEGFSPWDVAAYESASLVGEFSLQADAISSHVSIAMTFAGSGSLIASSASTSPAGALLSGNSGMSVDATFKGTFYGSALLAGVGNLAGSITLITPEQGAALLSGTSSLGTAATLIITTTNTVVAYSQTLNADVSEASQSLRINTLGGLSSRGYRVRVTFQAASGGAWNVNHASIGQQVGSAPYQNTVATPIELLFSGGSGFSLAAGGSITSDWLDFEIRTSQTYIITTDCAATANVRQNTGGSNQFWNQAGGASYNQAAPGGSWTFHNGSIGFSQIEVAVGTTFAGGSSLAVDTGDPATLTWKAAVIAAGGTVSQGREALVNNLITGLKADGVWSKLDRLWIFAAENSQSALIDLVAAASASLAPTNPSFTTDRGYTGNGSGYIDTNYNPSSGGLNHTQNSAHWSLWVASGTPSAGNQFLCGHNGASDGDYWYYFSDLHHYMRCHDNGTYSDPAAVTGHVMSSRSSSSTRNSYRNGSSFATVSVSSVAIDNAALCVLGASNAGNQVNGVVASAFSSGGSLDSGSDASNFYSRLRTYMTAVGVP